MSVGEEVVARTFMQKAGAGADRSQPPHGGFWGFPNVSEERKPVLICITQGWVGEAELRRKQPKSKLPFSLLL